MMRKTILTVFLALLVMPLALAASAEIIPEYPTTNDDLYCTIQDYSGYSYVEWYINGDYVDNDPNVNDFMLPASLTETDDQIYCEHWQTLIGQDQPIEGASASTTILAEEDVPTDDGNPTALIITLPGEVTLDLCADVQETSVLYDLTEYVWIFGFNDEGIGAEDVDWRVSVPGVQGADSPITLDLNNELDYVSFTATGILGTRDYLFEVEHPATTMTYSREVTVQVVDSCPAVVDVDAPELDTEDFTLTIEGLGAYQVIDLTQASASAANPIGVSDAETAVEDLVWAFDADDNVVATYFPTAGVAAVPLPAPANFWEMIFQVMVGGSVNVDVPAQSLVVTAWGYDNPELVQTATLDMEVVDEAGNEADGSLTITIENPGADDATNDAPDAYIPDQTVEEDGSITLDLDYYVVDDNDADEDLVWEIVGVDPHVSASLVGHDLTLSSATVCFIGRQEVTLRVTDTDGEASVVSFYLDIVEADQTR